MNSKLKNLWVTKNKNDEWWSSFVTSPLAILANYLVIDWKWVTPNRLTALSFIVACASIALIIQGGRVEFITAAILIHASHVLDCMDGQMARYRKVTSRAGSFLDKLTDQVQVILWFGAIGYASYQQSGDVQPVFLAFTGVSFYSLRGYVKYVTIYTEMADDPGYLKRTLAEARDIESRRVAKAGPGFGMKANLRWFAGEQRKIFSFDEGVFIFMLSVALILNTLTAMLWVFAVTQIFYGIARSIQRARKLHLNQSRQILTTTEK
jgi:phosphatidylglycerophosphate synthase